MRHSMRKLSFLILSLALVPALAFAAEPPPPPPDDAAEAARPPDEAPDVQPPPPPAVPPARDPQDDPVGILQQHPERGAGVLQGSSQPAPSGAPAGQWVYTNQYGWVWMPYGPQYVDEGTYGAATPYQFVYTVRLGWTWCAAPWLWGWGPYPWFGRLGPSRFGWYRGLYRSGYGWGRYRGGYPRGIHRGGGYPRGGYVRGGGTQHPTRPLGGSIIRGGVAPPHTGTQRFSARPARSRTGSWGAGRIAPGGGRGSIPHALAPRGATHRR